MQRRIAYVAVEDAACRAAISDVLHRQSWSVVIQPTGFHVLSGVMDALHGEAPLPDLLVIDAIARGCSGLTIAAGMRDLDVRIPTVLIARAGFSAPASDDPLVRVTSAAAAPSVVADVASTACESGSPAYVDRRYVEPTQDHPVVRGAVGAADRHR